MLPNLTERKRGLSVALRLRRDLSAVPTVATLKAFADAYPSLGVLGEFLGR